MAEENKESGGDASSPTGNYMNDMKERKEQSIQKAMEKIEKDRAEVGEMQRFGYFSIPFPQTYGDKAYSQNKQFENHQIIDGKVITEKRGIYTNPGKKGKGNEVYFSQIEPLSKEQVEEYKQDTINKRAKYLEDLKVKRETKEGQKFKPGGPQEVTGFYRIDDEEREKIKPTGPIYKVKDKFRFIKEGKVITENRGIFTNPTKTGGVTSLYPSDFFGVYVEDDKIKDLITRKAKEEEDKKIKEREFRKDKSNRVNPFIPASLKKCDCFMDNVKTYGIPKEQFDSGMEEFKYYKKNGRPKYSYTLPEGCVKHDKPFSPPKLISTGRTCLFNDNLYTLPELPPEKKMSLQERLEYEKANRKETFRYNRLMNHSTFSPAISSFKNNLRSEFRGIKF